MYPLIWKSNCNQSILCCSVKDKESKPKISTVTHKLLDDRIFFPLLQEVGKIDKFMKTQNVGFLQVQHLGDTHKKEDCSWQTCFIWLPAISWQRFKLKNRRRKLGKTPSFTIYEDKRQSRLKKRSEYKLGNESTLQRCNKEIQTLIEET